MQGKFQMAGTSFAGAEKACKNFFLLGGLLFDAGCEIMGVRKGDNMKTEQFAKLPDITLHVLRVKQIGKEPIFFKSKSLQKLEEVLKSLDYWEYRIDSYTCKDTLESDENHELCGIKSFVGEYL